MWTSLVNLPPDAPDAGDDRPAGVAMTDARWLEIDSDFAASVQYFSSAIRIYLDR